MKTKLSPAAVGMFVLGAALLLTFGFISFGGGNIFSKPSRFVVYFEESVSGLDPGASVKISGVRIGRVAAINVRYDAATRAAHVETICEIDRNVVTDPEGRTIDITQHDELQNLIDRGLRARLTLQGITGLLFVELSFQDPREYPAVGRFAARDYPVVPAIPSPISELQNSVVEIVASIKKVDFPGLNRDIRALLATANTRLGELDVKQINERITRTATAIEELVSSPEAKKTFANLNAAIAEAREVIAKVDGQVAPVSAEVRQTLDEAQVALKSLDSAAATTQRFIRDQSHVGDEVTVALRQIAEAAEALQRLADMISRNPSSLLVGTKKD
jgi:paraquat-inducible protein B